MHVLLGPGIQQQRVFREVRVARWFDSERGVCVPDLPDDQPRRGGEADPDEEQARQTRRHI